MEYLHRLVSIAIGLIDAESEYRYDTLNWTRRAEVNDHLSISLDDDLVTFSIISSVRDSM